MTSIAARPKQIDEGEQGWFLPLSSLQGLVYAFTPGSGAGGSFAQGSFSTASWCTVTYNGKPNPYLSSLNGVGSGLLKDMGKTVVSANRTFRKIQLRTNGTINAPYTQFSTGGIVGDNLTTTPVQNYLTGFIEMGFGGAGPFTPVVKYGM